MGELEVFLQKIVVVLEYLAGIFFGAVVFLAFAAIMAAILYILISIIRKLMDLITRIKGNIQKEIDRRRHNES